MQVAFKENFELLPNKTIHSDVYKHFKSEIIGLWYLSKWLMSN